ncbi:MAG: hypothetical protein JKX98_07665 [Alcanivoracaceae bacterium]|nr:hypothetical protein [Alcanivoracaceae bacterium]
MNRREFLKISTITGFNVCVFPLEALAFLPVLGRLMYAIGVGVIAENINRYLWGKSGNVSSEVNGINKELNQRGFTDSITSKVHKTDNIVMYSCNEMYGLNSCTPFILISPAGSKAHSIIMIEGPGMEALAFTANFLKNKGIPSYIIKDILLPRELIQDTSGTFESGYIQPEIFKTNTGIVTLDYSNKSKGKGEVTVYIKSNLLKGGYYDKRDLLFYT